MKKILLSLFAFSGLLAAAQINDISLSSTHTAVTVGDSTTITTNGSQIGYNYILRDNSDNSVITFPKLGTGDDLVFSTGEINADITYNVLVSNAITLEFNENYSSILLGEDNRTVEAEVTTAAWIKSSSTYGQLRNIVQQYGSAEAGYILRLATNGKAYMSGREQTTNYRSSGESTTVLTDNEWHYVVGTINLTSGVWSVYVDGVLENSQTYPEGVSLATTSSQLKIGGTFSSSRSIIGDVRDVTIWNKSLSASEIATNFTNCISGSEDNVVGHFPLNEGQGTEIFDYSEIAINGTNNVGNITYPWKEEYTDCSDTLVMTELVSVSVSAAVLVNAITVQGQNGVSLIDTDFGTLQMEAEILPVNALNGTYTWTVIDGTGSATISTTGVLSAVNNGTVSVTATANDGSGTNASVIITISNQTVGLNEHQIQTVNVYPNPVKNKLFIEINDLKITRISILDYSGRLVKSRENINIKQIDVSDLKQGIYILKVSTENGISTNRFVKQ